jgi:hypothetical protein
MRLVADAIAPVGSDRGRTAEFEIVAPLIHDPQRAGVRTDVLRVRRSDWQELVWGGLPPFALRVACWLLATRDPATTFHLGTSEVAQAFNATEPRAAAAIKAITGPVITEIERPDPSRRRAGLYRLRPGLLVGQHVAANP